MNILFFLTPKGEVRYLESDVSVSRAIDIMMECRYSAIPIIDKEGTYIGTITEGDLFLYYKESIKRGEDLLSVNILDVPRRLDNRPVLADTNMEDLLDGAMNQNFVPVIDDRKFFIGIITRKEIIKFLYENYCKKG